MNKYSKVVAVFFCFVVLSVNISRGDAMYTFVTNVNSAWASTNYAQILQIINDRLAQDSDDILALGAKQAYYIICDVNISNAHAAAHAFTNAAYQTGRADIMPIVEHEARLILDIPVTSTWSYTSAQIELHHQGGGSEYFVSTLVPLNIERQLEQPASNYPAITIESMPTNGIYIDISEERFGRSPTNTPYTRVYFQNQEVTVTAPEESGTNTFLRWSSDGTNELGITTNITFTMTTSNITAIAVYGDD